MEETNELRDKAPSPMPAPTNPNPAAANNPSKTREEGELSASDDDELPAHPVAQPTRTVVPVAEPVPVPPVNKYTQGVKAGKAIPASNPASSINIQSRPAVQSNYHRNFEKNRVPFKSGSSGWYASSGANNNLVIRFSDDDSGSDSEEYKQEKALDRKGNAIGVDVNRRLPASSFAKSEMLQGTTKNETKPMPKQGSLGRTFISSITKINGANSRGAGTSLVEQGSRLRNFNALNRNLANRERGSSQGAVLDNSKVQDLRARIAIRESELKLKSAQQNKETVSGSCRDYNAMSLNNDAAGKGRAASADIVQAEPKEPDKKRIKVSKPYSSQLDLDNQPKISAAKSILALKELASESCGPNNKNKVECSRCDKEIPVGRLQDDRQVAVRQQKQDDKRVAVSLGNLPSGSDGADINASCSQSDRITRQGDTFIVNQAVPIVNITSNTFPKEPNAVELNHPSKVRGRNPSSSFLRKSTSEHNLMRSNECREVISGDKSLMPMSNNMYQACSLKVPDSKLETSDASQSLWNCLGNVNVSGPGNISLQSLLEIEDLQDKELEEAQEHRRRCEIEERNALKAYRKAQRALIEANARCNNFYRQRELYSAQFQSLITEDSNLLWSSKRHELGRIGLNSSYDTSEGHMDLIPTSSHQMQAEFDSNIHCVNSAPLNTSYRHVDGQNLGSEPCSEPDGSTSELLPRKGNGAANGVCSPSNDANISADEDEQTFSFDHESIQPSPECQRKGVSFEERENDIDDDSRRKFSIGTTQDSLLLEASLRSELFARLGMRALSKDSGCGAHSVEPAVERGAESDVGSEKSQMSMGKLPLSEADKSQHSDIGGTDRSEKTITEVPVENDNQRASHATTDPEENGERQRSTSSVTFSPPSILRSAFGHMRVTFPISVLGLQTRDKQNQTYDINNEGGTDVSSDEIQRSSLVATSVQETVRDIFAKEFGSYTCDLAIDPFWPLCMYELRGKCNDEECSWQHVKDYSSGTTNQHDHSNRAAQSIGQCWQKSFSASLAVSRLLQRYLPADEPFLLGRDGHIEVHGSWDRQSLYFQSGNGAANQLKHDLADNVQSLEMALLILNQEVNKSVGMKKALSVLSRALEADPMSVALWIVYLLIYYSNKKSIGKDDMFCYAVKLNEGSYELWLLYINSRMQLDDRLVAYDTALSALCRQASASDRDMMHASSCILDLFLQMVDCLCMSGDVGKAIQRIYGFFPAATNSEPHSLLLSDILTCLTISDKCIFWVCCVYLVIYRKLPDAVVQWFECEKDLLAIEWPSVELRVDEKRQAIKLMEMAVASVESYIISESLESETTLRSAHLFALSHIRCMVALDGLDCSWNLLDKYIKLYPSCLELVLMSARVQKHDFGDLSFVGFEEALSKWPKDVPGIQCIWNQYAEYALQNGRFDFAKELMLRWFHSVWKVQYPQNGILDAMDGDNPCCSFESASASNRDVSISYSKQSDIMFGLLNLSLHRLLQNDHIEARLAIDRALKAAAPENYKHCVREHAMFLLSGCSQLNDGASISQMLNILNGYLVGGLVFPVPQPLSRKFIQSIKKPRIRQLISNILNPISFDFSLVNLVLEVWHGPSLLPHKFSKQKDLVDFVEAIMEIVPSNYQLSLSVCKLLSRDLNPVDVTSAGVLFWASSLLVDAIFQAVPVAPEHVWVEALDILGNITDVQAFSEMFHKRALSVYPFSIKLWKSYLNLSKTTGNRSAVFEAAKEKGIKLDDVFS